ncbi:hypothetical protein [Marinithermus hydrothermalis]|uniref:Uncharacterized protein n=1 Tax=Marinithermus hydrothermalis (strain DSM 14884 / JCM 11576 / T1) TaxID=869210 RepID=F2NQW6_MARHT|nr:hypothetical protein [Marinithermus hydrothermalis]AEB12330.1 hypothetical protein Marky_1595 [Marinithermus hydrothermalis DSM 14884]
MEKEAAPPLTQQLRAPFFVEALRRFLLNRGRCLALDARAAAPRIKDVMRT